MKKKSMAIIFVLFVIIIAVLYKQNDGLFNNLQQRQNFLDGVSESNLQGAVVVRVIDGDTIIVSVSGEEKTIRMIGIDSPESVHPDSSKNTVWGGNASDYTKENFQEGQIVYLQKDISEKDEYNRLLRYVWTEEPENIEDEIEMREKLYNAKIIREGYASAYYYLPDVLLSDFFKILEDEAREDKVGIWKK